MKHAPQWKRRVVVLASLVATAALLYWFLPLAPDARVPEDIDLGDVESGQAVRVSFPVRNDGWQPLVLTNWRTSCSCTAVLKNVDGDWMRLTPAAEERIDAGASAELAVEFNAYTTVDGPFTHRLQYTTNDPRRPQAELQVHGRVFLGLYTEPRALGLGTIRPGETVRRSVTLVDARPGPAPRAFRLVRERGALRTLGEPVAQGDGRRYRVEVEIQAPAQPTTIEAALAVQDGAGSTRFVLPVNGVCARPIYLAPSVLVVPAGAPGTLFQRTCLCRFAAGPARVAVTKVPEGVRARIAEPVGGGSDHKLIRIECDAAALARRQEAAVVVEAVDARGHAERLELKIVPDIARP